MTTKARKKPREISRRDIEAAYDLALGRSPESEAAYSLYSAFPNVSSVLKALIESVEFQEKRARSRGFASFYDGAAPAELLARYSELNRAPVAGAVVNFIGVNTKVEFASWAAEGVEGLPVPGNFHATQAEWTAVLRSIDLAKNNCYTVIELGAGWGCWMVNTAFAAKKMGFVVDAVGVEGDSSHVKFIRQHAIANGLQADEFEVVEAVIGSMGGGAAFPVYENSGFSYGQEPRFFESDPELDEFISSASEPYRKVPSRTLQDVIGARDRVDLLHIDIQGEEATLVRRSLETLNDRVAYIVIGTHGRDREGELISLLSHAGWALEVEEPCTLPLPLEYNRPYIDGLQGWRNRRLTM